jgi:hypothetical protein
MPSCQPQGSWNLDFVRDVTSCSNRKPFVEGLKDGVTSVDFDVSHYQILTNFKMRLMIEDDAVQGSFFGVRIRF